MSFKIHTKLDISSNFIWVSHERYWAFHEKSWYISYLIFFSSLIFFLAVIGEYILIVAILSFMFLWFIQAIVPPEQTTHKINQFGIKTFGKLYKWKDIQHFWFSKKNGIYYLHLEIINKTEKDTYIPSRLSLLLENNEMDEIFWILVNEIDYGDVNEVGFNFITQYINGDYIEISEFLPEEASSQEEFLDMRDSN